MNNTSIYTYSPIHNMTTENPTNDYYEQALDIRNKQHIALQKALVSAIAETTDVHADSNNPFHKSKYASLNAHLALIKPIFAKHGLAVLQFPVGSENSVGINTIIIHNEGGRIEEQAYIPCPQGIDGQKAGSIYSYLRRYALAAVAGVATEDDDANVVSVPSAPKQTYVSAPTSKFIPNPNVSKVATGEIDFTLPVPFGKAKGTALQDLPLNDLNYWANTWEPKPWEKTGKVGIKDLSLKSSAQALWAIKNGGGEAEAEPTEDAIPF
jgi:hypothetical protein